MLRGQYLRPFGEYTSLSSDFEIFAAAAQKNLRPTVPGECPLVLSQLVVRAYDRDADARPETAEIVAVVERARAAYSGGEQDAWNRLLPPKIASSGSGTKPNNANDNNSSRRNA